MSVMFCMPGASGLTASRLNQGTRDWPESEQGACEVVAASPTKWKEPDGSTVPASRAERPDTIGGRPPKVPQ